MEILKALEQGARAFRACRGEAKLKDRKRYAKELMLTGVFNQNEISHICNLSKRPLRAYPEYVYCSKRNSVHFNPSSLDLFIFVRRRYISGLPLRNAWFSVLFNDGNSTRVIAYFTGMERGGVERRVRGQITTEWVNHNKRLGGNRSVKTAERSKRDGD